MAGEANGSVGQDLHALIAPQGLEVAQIEMKSMFFGLDDLAICS